MTDCNRDPLDFPTLGSKNVVADFQGGRLTTDAGALILREVAPVFIVHQQRTLLAQRVIAIAPGYEDLNDPQTRMALGFS